MKKILLPLRFCLLFAVIILCINNTDAQVKIGTNPATVNANSLLELESTGKGLLLPRSTTAQITAMTSVPTGMLLFNTTDSALYLKRDTGWIIIPVSKRGVNPTLQSPTYADFYALMPGDNPGPVFPGSIVQFPQNGPISGGIIRAGIGSFILQAAGTYQVMFEVTVNEPGQLMISVNGLDLPHTVVGRAASSSQITGISLITTASPNSLLEIRNPPGNVSALTVTPTAGGNRPVSAHLVITKL